MRSVVRSLVVGLCMIVDVEVASAATITFSGYFNDPGNAALVASDFAAPLFGNDDEIANNVALYELVVPVAGNVTLTSVGYAAGGAEPYLSVFAGTGTAATFVTSTFFDPSIDFSLTTLLNAGTYTLAIGTWLNMSFAENNPDLDPTLGDGFTLLGEPGRLGTSYYEVQAQTPSVAEPSILLLFTAALAARRRWKISTGD